MSGNNAPQQLRIVTSTPLLLMPRARGAAALLAIVFLTLSCTRVFIHRCDLIAQFPQTPLVVVDSLSKNRLSFSASLGVNPECFVSRDTSNAGVITYYKNWDTSNHDFRTYYRGFQYLDSADTGRNNLFWYQPRSTASFSAVMNLWNIVSGLTQLQLGYRNGLKYEASLGLAIHYCFGPVSFQANGMCGLYNSDYTVSYLLYGNYYDMGVTTIEFEEGSAAGRNSNMVNQLNCSVNTTGLPWVNFLMNIGGFQARYLSVPQESISCSRSFLKFSPAAFTTINRVRLILFVDMILDEQTLDESPFSRVGITTQWMSGKLWN